MRCLTFEIILHKRQSSFYASVTPRQKGPETKEKNKETDTRTIMLYSRKLRDWGYKRTKDKTARKKQKL